MLTRELPEGEQQPQQPVAKRAKRLPRSVCVMVSDAYLTAADRGGRLHGERLHMWHSLSRAYGLFSYPHVELVAPMPASFEELEEYHSVEYLTALRDANDYKIDNNKEHGLQDDCPYYEHVFEDSCLLAGASLQAARRLMSGGSDVGLALGGGRHHAQRSRAAGFCYVNDIVLSLLALSGRFDRVMYIDLDIHHGDGVQQAFYMSSNVFTVSFHMCRPGFFPGTGKLNQTGVGDGLYYNLNVPLPHQTQDAFFKSIVHSTISSLFKTYQPQALVVQCGCDALYRDSLVAEGFHLTSKGFGDTVAGLLSLPVPVLLLGGGGLYPT